MKRAIIYAYTAHNLGDDLFIHIVCTRYPKTNFFIYAPKHYEETFAYLPNLHIVHSDHVLHKIKRIFFRSLSFREPIERKCDVAIYIGGSLFFEKKNWRQEVKHLSKTIHHNQPFFIIGANFGPFEKKDFYSAYEKVFQNCTDICFRDKASQQLFYHLPNVRQAADVVFQLSNKNTLKTKKQIIISVIYPSLRNDLQGRDQQYFTAMARIATHCIENGFDVILMSFCELEKDHHAVAEIISLIPAAYLESIDTYFYKTDLKAALQQIAQSKAIVATRFHAMILGWVYEKPVVPILYSNKMRTVIEENKFSGKYYPLEQAHTIDLQELMHALLTSPLDITEQRKDAVDQFQVLDRYLLENLASH